MLNRPNRLFFALFAATLLTSTSAIAKDCTVGMIAMANEFGVADYDSDVFFELLERGYVATTVRDRDEAAKFALIGEVEIDCQSAATDPLRTSSVTTLRLINSKNNRTYFQKDSLARPAYGSCHVDLISIIRKLPICR